VFSQTLLARAIATAAGCAYFAASSGDVLDVYQGNSEKKLRELFQGARGGVLFFDELDSVASSRQSDETQSVRSIKAELLTQITAMLEDPGSILLGATNCPWDLDGAVRRRFEKRVYIPLPDRDDRRALLSHELERPGAPAHQCSETDLDAIADATPFYSGSDMAQLLTAAHSLSRLDVARFDAEPNTLIKPPLTVEHLRRAMATQKASVGEKELKAYTEWTALYGQEGK